MSCGGIQGAAQEVTKLADGIKDFGKDLAEDALGSVASLVQAQVGALNAEIDKAFPDLPEPAKNLQDEMTKLAGAADNPGEFMQTLEGMKESFGDTVDLDSVMGEAGIDVDQVNKLSSEVQGIINNPKGAVLDAVDGSTPEGITNLIGGFDSPFNQGLEDFASKVCELVPNFEISADGIMKKLGIPTPVPSKDAEAVEAPPSKVSGGETDVPPGNGNIKGHSTVKTRLETIAVKALEKARNLRIQQEVKALYAVRDTQEDTANKSRKASDAKRLEAIMHHIQQAKRDIEYEFQNELYILGARADKPKKPELSRETFETIYKDNMDYGAQTEALPNLVIVG